MRKLLLVGLLTLLYGCFEGPQWDDAVDRQHGLIGRRHRVVDVRMDAARRQSGLLLDEKEFFPYSNASMDFFHVFDRGVERIYRFRGAEGGVHELRVYVRGAHALRTGRPINCEMTLDGNSRTVSQSYRCWRDFDFVAVLGDTTVTVKIHIRRYPSWMHVIARRS